MIVFHVLCRIFGSDVADIIYQYIRKDHIEWYRHSVFEDLKRKVRYIKFHSTYDGSYIYIYPLSMHSPTWRIAHEFVCKKHITGYVEFQLMQRIGRINKELKSFISVIQ